MKLFINTFVVFLKLEEEIVILRVKMACRIFVTNVKLDFGRRTANNVSVDWHKNEFSMDIFN